jgi:membrane protease YdiL (CAAX protease family)
MGLGAFAIAFFSRKPRSPVAFGLRAVSWKWILAGIGLGLVAYVLTKVVTIALLLISPSDTNVQQDYVTAASSGPLLLVLNLIGLAVITPLGEEFAFRGVLMNALQKYGFWISAIASTIVFALAHGVNLVIVPAVFVGFAAALLFWKTKSVWPGVAVHAVNNGLGIALVGLLGSSGA